MIFKYEVIVERRVFCQRITTQGTFKCTLLLRKYLIIFRPYQHEWLIIFISKRDVFFLIRNMMTYIRLRWISFPSLFVLFKVFLWCEFERERVSCKLILWWYAGKSSYNKKVSEMWWNTSPMNIYLPNSLSRIRISEVLYNTRSFFWTCIPAL